jgi:hypothetical protein
MRHVIGQTVLALLLFGLGFMAWTAGSWERRVADARESFAKLQYAAMEAEYADLEQSMGLAGIVPWLADRLLGDAQRDRAAGEYWQARYDALEPQANAAGSTSDREPSLLSMEANAQYRSGQQQGGDRQAVLRHLDAALKAYANLLKRSESDADAAYNYELIVRLRDALSRSRPQPGRHEELADARKPAAAAMAGDLPEGRTIHGDPGAPPPNTDMTQFKMHIPVRPDERQGGSDAGQGGQKVRKG